MAKRSLTKVSLQDLLAQLKKHQARLPKLQRKEKKLLKQLTAVQAEIAELGGAATTLPKSAKGSVKQRGRPAGKTSKRAKNKVKLADAIVAVLSKDKSVSVKEIISAVKAGGYVSTSKTFGTIVYQTLGRDKRVKRAGRGKYQLKG
jgi:cell division septum initiation protein DivIVA